MKKKDKAEYITLGKIESQFFTEVAKVFIQAGLTSASCTSRFPLWSEIIFLYARVESEANFIFS